MFVPGQASVVRDLARLHRELLVIAAKAPGVSIGPKILPWIKTKAGDVSERSDFLPVVSRAMRLRTILDHTQFVFSGDGHNRFHLCGKAVEMNWNDGFGSV